ncbi:MAG TPA: sigma-70 family RNA polymerase sigma factor [Gammaproteobacteria bacterium]|nr:sigma-70 family RNA polymerase sigma factor [Gammaproteobacteria bacterium]
MAPETDTAGRLPLTIADREPDWDTVYAQQLPRIYNFFCYRLRHEATAEDLTSQTFEKAWRARHRYRKDIAGFATWLVAIARNVANDHLRARRQHAPLEAAADVADACTPEDAHSHASDRERLAALLERLPERERELLAMKYGAGLTNRAIAELTRLSESNVGTIVHRAVQTLRRDW